MHHIVLPYSGAILQCSETYKHGQGNTREPRTLTQTSHFIRWTLVFKTLSNLLPPWKVFDAMSLRKKCFATEHSHASPSLSWLPRIRTSHRSRSPKLSLLWQCGGVSYSSLKTIYRLEHLKALGISIHTELCYRIGGWVQNVIHRKKKKKRIEYIGFRVFVFWGFSSKGNMSWISAVFFLMMAPHDWQIIEFRRLKQVNKSGSGLISPIPILQYSDCTNCA